MLSIPHRTELSHRLLQRAKSGLAMLPARALRRVARWLEIRRQMHQLAELDQHLLRDIGLAGDDGPRPIIRPQRR